MRFPSLFKTKHPRGFNFQPRYYDERKERLEKLRRAAEKEVELEQSERTLKKGELQSAWRKNQVNYHQKRSNTRIFLIAGVLAVIFYLLLK